MGNRIGTSEANSNAGYHGLHVWKLSTNIFYNDGVDAVSDPAPCLSDANTHVV